MALIYRIGAYKLEACLASIKLSFACGAALLLGCATGPAAAPTNSYRTTPDSLHSQELESNARPAGVAKESALYPSIQAPPVAPVIPTGPKQVEPLAIPEGMLRVPGGTFTMGTDSGGEEDEHPSHSVTVADFWLDVTEATVKDYTECMRAGACVMYRQDAAKSIRAGDDSKFRQPLQPISGISWEQAKAYCEYRGKRLPREAEWERAARGDDNRKYPWGDSTPEPTIHACFARHIGTPLGTTCDVGSYPRGAGPYGHLDLAGNVWEWMSDYYDPFAYRRANSNHGEPGTCEQNRLNSELATPRETPRIHWYESYSDRLRACASGWRIQLSRSWAASDQSCSPPRPVAPDYGWCSLCQRCNTT